MCLVTTSARSSWWRTRTTATRSKSPATEYTSATSSRSASASASAAVRFGLGVDQHERGDHGHCGNLSKNRSGARCVHPVMTRDDAYRTDHAVVIGAGTAALLAARLLADRFARVTIVERADLPSRHRRGSHGPGLAAVELDLPGGSRRSGTWSGSTSPPSTGSSATGTRCAASRSTPTARSAASWPTWSWTARHHPAATPPRPAWPTDHVTPTHGIRILR